MRLNLTKTKGIVLLALLGSVVGTSNPALAAPKNLQWRSTRCEVGTKEKVLRRMDCTVAFTSKGEIYGVKFIHQNGTNVYFNYDQDYTNQTNIRECLTVEFKNGVEENYCTLKTPWELGIKGAPYAVSPSDSNNAQPAPSYNTRPAGPDPNSRLNVMIRCTHAFPNHGYANHPEDKIGYQNCMKMNGQD